MLSLHLLGSFVRLSLVSGIVVALFSGDVEQLAHSEARLDRSTDYHFHLGELLHYQDQTSTPPHLSQLDSQQMELRANES